MKTSFFMIMYARGTGSHFSSFLLRGSPSINSLSRLHTDTSYISLGLNVSPREIDCLLHPDTSNHNNFLKVTSFPPG